MKLHRTALRAVARVFGLCLLGGADPRLASADQSIGVVQVTCAPEVGYFSIRRFTLPPYATDEQFQSLISGLASAHRVYSAKQLKAAPAECNLVAAVPGQPGRKRMIRVRAEGFFDSESEAMSPRQIMNYVEVSSDGKVIGLLGLNLYTFRENTTDLIEVFTDGLAVFARKCAYYAPLELQPKQGCTSEQL
jgi:hypothetical protein